MASIKEGPGYIFIPKFFDQEELNILKSYTLEKLNDDQLALKCNDGQSPLAPSYYKDPLMQVFLQRKKSIVQKYTQLSLDCAYTYWRYYFFGSILKDHMDRASCEVSVTACISQSEQWPIHMNNNWLSMEEGDAVAYLGCDVLHGRKPFKGDHNAQVFLHYVDVNGENKDYANDPKELRENK
jgi:hypothetical protein